jgi:hypothetical protein
MLVDEIMHKPQMEVWLGKGLLFKCSMSHIHGHLCNVDIHIKTFLNLR